MRKLFIKIAFILIFCAINIKTITAQQFSILQSNACLNDTLFVPVNYNNIDSIGALTLYITYDTSVLTFVGSVNEDIITPGLMCGVPAFGPNAWQVVISWVGDPLNNAGVDLVSGKLCDVKFLYKGGSSALNFLTSSELVDPDLNVINVAYSNDSIVPTVISQPTPAQICEGGQTSFFVSATTGSTYQWQVLNGVQWDDLQNDTAYSGVNTGTLQIQQALDSQNNTIYRCAVTKVCTQYSDTVVLTVYPNPVIVITNDTAVCIGDSVVLNATGTTGTGTLLFDWDHGLGGGISHVVNPSVTSVYHLTVTDDNTCFSDDSVTIVIIQVPSPADTISGIPDVCLGQNGVPYSIPAIADATGYIWTYSGTGASIIGSGNNITIDFSMAATSGNLTVLGSNACSNGTVSANYLITVNQFPTAEAGETAIFNGPPIQIGDSTSGPGTFNWAPAAGLSDTTIARPLASPLVTTIYTLTVNNNSCISTDTVTIVLGGYTLNGKTRYAGKARAGNPAPNVPTYNPVIYNIDNVIVILKSYPEGVERSRDTSDASGTYQLTHVVDGSYILSYDKYTADTMQSGNHVNTVDLAILKYLLGHDTVVDPSRSFSAKYKKAANVDNSETINTIDIARITAKIGLPGDHARNFPKGNWVALDTLVTVAGSDLNIPLQTICYGDYDASSSRYKDSATTWNLAKSLPDENIILRSDESIILNNPVYFEVPLRISAKMNELSALGLELSYSGNEYKLVTAYMPKTSEKDEPVKINPTMEEIIADNNDLVVTDADGIIRVVFATTDHFDVAANDEMIRLGFRSFNKLDQGELDFNLSGTGLIANQYGEINENLYLTMPKIFVQGNNSEARFEFAGYPNPFSGDATLTYYIPKNGAVKLNVYNSIGELVSELLNESQISGNHSVIFSPKNLPSGMYTFKLEFAGFDNSKCLILKMIR